MDAFLECDSTYNDREFSQISVKNETLRRVYFNNIRFFGVDFQFCTLNNCLFENCTFLNCNCSVMKIRGSEFRQDNFIECKLMGIDWSGAGKTLGATFTDSMMDKSAFSEQNLSRFLFKSCTLRDALFQSVSLRNANFLDCDLTNCHFHNSDLTNTDFSTARNYFINISANTVHKTKFSLPEALSLLGNFDITLVES